jgi:hypothetical protein
MLFNTSPGSQTQGSLQIIHYNGPPKPKQPSQRSRYKISSSDERQNEEDLTITSDNTEFVDLTFLGG